MGHEYVRGCFECLPVFLKLFLLFKKAFLGRGCLLPIPIFFHYCLMHRHICVEHIFFFHRVILISDLRPVDFSQRNEHFRPKIIRLVVLVLCHVRFTIKQRLMRLVFLYQVLCLSQLISPTILILESFFDHLGHLKSLFICLDSLFFFLVTSTEIAIKHV